MGQREKEKASNDPFDPALLKMDCKGNDPEVRNDPVNHPAHYTSGGIEVIDAIEAWGLGFHLGCALKYLVRAGKKNPEKEDEDLRKAVWYINRYIDWTLEGIPDGNQD